ncbi:MAG TPA: uroporphyrinogen decarboxylase family protein [Candidatus Eisenbacteria bacterium]|nr:uroporphyrinogen decarboxylase family protein [Candidatus Eisenbacteria bacterium]
MTRRERIRKTLAGEPTDRPPISFWRHFYHREGSAADLAASMLEFQKRYDWDLLKVNPRGSYHVEDWGVRTARPGTGPLDKPKVVEGVIRAPGDWDRIQPVDPTRGALGEHLDALERIAAEAQGDVDWVMTVFNPISIAADLANDDAMFVSHLREHGDRVHGALRAIAETYAGFVRECLARGAAGIFFATTDYANDTRIDRAAMNEFARPYDLRVLAEAASAPLNTLHVCGPGAYVEDLLDYPVSIVSWADRAPRNPSIAALRGKTSKTLLAGLAHDGVLLTGPIDAVQAEARDAIAASGGTRFILGPGCAVPAAAPLEHFQAVREVALACA